MKPRKIFFLKNHSLLYHRQINTQNDFNLRFIQLQFASYKMQIIIYTPTQKQHLHKIDIKQVL